MKRLIIHYLYQVVGIAGTGLKVIIYLYYSFTKAILDISINNLLINTQEIYNYWFVSTGQVNGDVELKREQETLCGYQERSKSING